MLGRLRKRPTNGVIASATSVNADGSGAARKFQPMTSMALRSWQNGRDNLEFGAGVLPYVEACLPTSDEY